MGYVEVEWCGQSGIIVKVTRPCTLTNESLWPSDKKPFDVLFQRVKNEEWLALVDDFKTFRLEKLDPEVLDFLAA